MLCAEGAPACAGAFSADGLSADTIPLRPQQRIVAELAAEPQTRRAPPSIKHEQRFDRPSFKDEARVFKVYEVRPVSAGKAKPAIRDAQFPRDPGFGFAVMIDKQGKIAGI